MKTPIALQVLPKMNQGGVEHATFDMAEALVSTYKTKTYVASNGGELLDKPHHFIHITAPLHSKNPLRMMQNAFILRKMIRSHGINIVHARSRAPAWSAWLACKMTGAIFVTTYHAAYKGKSFIKKLYNSVMARGHRVIAISDFIQNHVLKNYPWANVQLIYEGIDTDFYTSTTDTKNPVIFLPSRLSPIKGIHIALKALAEVIKTHPNVKLMLIQTGKPNYIKEIDTLIEKRHLNNHVIFIPPTSDLRPYYEKASIALMTSVVPEALGRISLEALAMKCLLIATAIGANPEICIDTKTGFLVPPGDYKKLALMMIYCLNLDDESKNSLYKRGRDHIEQHFSSNTMHQKTIELYESLL
ncbi:MAG: glycosyltransferase family 4 protein [Alphaproteobacteria bacterium]|nr:glycosyltransferase family 4 protein [Alphaproteobacteria bacterium]